jgi:hypothetical protein
MNIDENYFNIELFIRADLITVYFLGKNFIIKPSGGLKLSVQLSTQKRYFKCMSLKSVVVVNFMFLVGMIHELLLCY